MVLYDQDADVEPEPTRRERRERILREASRWRKPPVHITLPKLRLKARVKAMREHQWLHALRMWLLWTMLALLWLGAVLDMGWFPMLCMAALLYWYISTQQL